MFHKDWEQGLKDLKRVIVLDPDHIKAKTIIMKTRKLKEKEEEGILHQSVEMLGIKIHFFVISRK